MDMITSALKLHSLSPLFLLVLHTGLFYFDYD